MSVDDAQLQRLMATRGPAYPPVAAELARRPDGDPLKQDMEQAAGAVVEEPSTSTVEQRLDAIEARLAALEGT